MPFEVLETITKATAPPQATLSYMRLIRKKKGGGEKVINREKIKPSLIVTVPTVIVISKAERFILMIGTGNEAGKLLLKAVDALNPKGIKPSEFKKHLVFRFGYVPRFGDEIFDDMKCDIRRESNDDQYVIDAPFLKATLASAEAVTKTVPLKRSA